MAGKGKQKQEDVSGPTRMEFENPPVPINKWSASAVKYALDDAMKKIAKEEFQFVENFSVMDQRLAICTIACSFSGFALAYDYLYPFPASRMVLAICAISYFVMMGVLTLFTMYREENITMVALEKDEAGVGPDNVWTYRTSMSKFSDMYSLKVTCKDGTTSQSKSREIKRSVSRWFDEKGRIVNLKFFGDVKRLHLDIGKKKTN